MKHQANAYQQAVGALMRQRRKELDVSIAYAARAIGVTPPALAAWERGDRAIKVETLAEIAEVYGCRTADLLPHEDGPWWRSW
jgi:transcriptional regulator with XRE-family HTH domain